MIRRGRYKFVHSPVGPRSALRPGRRPRRAGQPGGAGQHGIDSRGLPGRSGTAMGAVATQRGGACQSAAPSFCVLRTSTGTLPTVGLPADAAMRAVSISAMTRNSTISKAWRGFRAWPETLALALLGLVGADVAAGAPPALEPASCRSVRMADVGWTDVTATTAVLTQVLRGLGYEPADNVAVRAGDLRSHEGRQHRRVSRQLDAGADP